jgi:hypothetical protein
MRPNTKGGQAAGGDVAVQKLFGVTRGTYHGILLVSRDPTVTENNLILICYAFVKKGASVTHDDFRPPRSSACAADIIAAGRPPRAYHGQGASISVY